MEQPKIYFTYTPYSLVYQKRGERKGKLLPAERATISLVKERDTLKFGVSVCSKYDSWNKEKGRKLATERMNQGFGVIKISPSLAKAMSSVGETKFMVTMLKNLCDSVTRKMNSYKHRIQDHTVSLADMTL